MWGCFVFYKDKKINVKRHNFGFMAKQKKERSENYDEKLSFDGDLSDLINISVHNAKQKDIKVGDSITEDGKECIVLGTTEDPQGYDIPKQFYCIVEDLETKKKYYLLR